MSRCERARAFITVVLLGVTALAQGQVPLEEIGVTARKRVFQKPVYPALAQASGVEGAVFLEVKISPAGEPTEVRVVWGHPLLDDAAVSAVKKWRYEPVGAENAPDGSVVTEAVGFFGSEASAALWYAGVGMERRAPTTARVAALLRVSELSRVLRLKEKQRANLEQRLQQARADSDPRIAKAAAATLALLVPQPVQ